MEWLEARTLLYGTWSLLTNLATESTSTMLLLTDGTVMVQGSGASWNLLRPGPSGQYQDGTWSSLPSMNYSRFYFGSNVLPDGDIFVQGGEVSNDPGALSDHESKTTEVFDPLANHGVGSWTLITPSFGNYGEAPSQLLPDGNVLVGSRWSPQTYIFDVATNTWMLNPTGTKLDGETSSSEESWVKLADGSILTYDLNPVGTGERYVPATNRWVATQPVGVDLSDDGELGPAFLLPDGRAFYVGADGNTAYFNPSTNSWSAGPVLPDGLGADDAPGAGLPNGDILITADTPSTASPGSKASGPTKIFQFDPGTGVFTDVTPSGLLLEDPTRLAFYNRMLMLPTGQVLFSDGTRQLALYTPDTGASPAWQPVVTGVSPDVAGSSSFTLTGLRLNGMSAGAAFGDDAEMDTNFPVVRASDTTGDVSYARTFNWSSTGVATGNTPESTEFSFPAGTALSAPLDVSVSTPAGVIEGMALDQAVVATFTDPAAGHAPANYSATIRWGDGSVSPGLVSGPDNLERYSVRGSHTYADEGGDGSPGSNAYTLSVAVAEHYALSVVASGIASNPVTMWNSGSGTAAVSVAEAPLIVSGGPAATAIAGTNTGDLVVATFTDPGGLEPLSDYRATIDWGDGSPPTPAAFEDSGGTILVAGSHVFSKPATYTVIAAIGHDGGAPQSASSTVIVSDPDPDLAGSGRRIGVRVGQMLNDVTVATFRAISPANDASPGSTASRYRAVIDWGDGSPPTTGFVIDAADGQESVVSSHTYTEVGRFPVRVIVTDTIHAGETVTLSGQAIVGPGQISVVGLDIRPTPGRSFRGAVAIVTDTDPRISPRDFRVRIRWGDGTITAGRITGSAGRFTITAGHIYPTRGPRRMTITLFEKHSGTKVSGNGLAMVDPARVTKRASKAGRG